MHSGSYTPIKNPKFRLYADGILIPGIIRFQGLHRYREIAYNEESGGYTSLPHPTIRYSPITLERELSADRFFQDWAGKVPFLEIDEDTQVPKKDFFKDLQLEILSAEGRVEMVFKIKSCWVVEHFPVAMLDNECRNDAVYETIRLEHEGWERES